MEVSGAHQQKKETRTGLEQLGRRVSDDTIFILRWTIY